MAYTKTIWEDLPSTNTPLNATNLNKIENELSALDQSTDYSSTEKVIGSWIDGKSIYRKVIDLGTLPNANTLTISSGINEQIYPIKIYGFATRSSETFPLPFIWGDTSNVNNYCGLFYSRNDNVIWFRTNRDMSQYTGYAIIEYKKMSE